MSTHTAPPPRARLRLRPCIIRRIPPPRAGGLPPPTTQRVLHTCTGRYVVTVNTFGRNSDVQLSWEKVRKLTELEVESWFEDTRRASGISPCLLLLLPAHSSSSFNRSYPSPHSTTAVHDICTPALHSLFDTPPCTPVFPTAPHLPPSPPCKATCFVPAL